MGRPSKGFRLKRQPGTDVLAVVWTQPDPKGGVKGREVQRSTGERDPVRAAKTGARIYAAAIRGGEAERSPTPRRPHDDLERLCEQWLTIRADLDVQTKATYALYFETHLGPYFGTLAGVSSDSVKAYSAKRLASVSASTVRHELSALRMLIRWAYPNENADTIVPSLPRSTRGVSYETSSGLRRRGKPTELTEQETTLIISALPEWSRAARVHRDDNGEQWIRGAWRYPIRARFIVKYETGLREGLLDQLSVPEHWSPDRSGKLRITDELDKMRYERTVPLTPAAQTALESVTNSGSFAGVVFGQHDYRCSVRAAARSAGIAGHRVKTLAPNDLRHARATHLGASPQATMAGLMHMFGWTQPSTAAKYMHPTEGAARKMLVSVSSVVAPTVTPSMIPSTAQENAIPASGESDDEPKGFG